MLCSLCCNLPARVVSESRKVGACAKCIRLGSRLDKSFHDCLVAREQGPDSGEPANVQQFSGTDQLHRPARRRGRRMKPAELAASLARTAAEQRKRTLKAMGLGEPVLLSTGIRLDRTDCQPKTIQRRPDRRLHMDAKVRRQVQQMCSGAIAATGPAGRPS